MGSCHSSEESHDQGLELQQQPRPARRESSGLRRQTTSQSGHQRSKKSKKSKAIDKKDVSGVHDAQSTMDFDTRMRQLHEQSATKHRREEIARGEWGDSSRPQVYTEHESAQGPPTCTSPETPCSTPSPNVGRRSPFPGDRHPGLQAQMRSPDDIGQTPPLGSGSQAPPPQTKGKGPAYDKSPEPGQWLRHDRQPASTGLGVSYGAHPSSRVDEDRIERAKPRPVHPTESSDSYSPEFTLGSPHLIARDRNRNRQHLAMRARAESAAASPQVNDPNSSESAPRRRPLASRYHRPEEQLCTTAASTLHDVTTSSSGPAPPRGPATSQDPAASSTPTTGTSQSSRRDRYNGSAYPSPAHLAFRMAETYPRDPPQAGGTSSQGGSRPEIAYEPSLASTDSGATGGQGHFPLRISDNQNNGRNNQSRPARR